MVTMQAKGAGRDAQFSNGFLLSIRRSWVKVGVGTAKVLQMTLFKPIKPIWCQTVIAQVPECQLISLNPVEGKAGQRAAADHGRVVDRWATMQ